MSSIVVPLSAGPKTAFTLQAFVENLLAMIVFGLVIAFFTHRFRSDGAGLR